MKLKIIIFLITGLSWIGTINCDYYGMGFPNQAANSVGDQIVYKKIPFQYLASTHGINFPNYSGSGGAIRKYYGQLAPFHHVDHPPHPVNYQPNYSYLHPKRLNNEGTINHDHSGQLTNHNDSNRSPAILGLRVNRLSWLRRPPRKGLFDRILG
ncbi:uncharacterized protein LOC128392646 [Panonychus citri]|uniref:uncharacterized protein LOC128392646 n=1 Tax=Panonychus citri TaxID=50023 RepID=UPI002306F90D|nr:uncharacterized protein LOC128392646 [Panonychus citri]